MIAVALHEQFAGEGKNLFVETERYLYTLVLKLRHGFVEPYLGCALSRSWESEAQEDKNGDPPSMGCYTVLLGGAKAPVVATDAHLASTL
jgi:hypothetical protein